MGASRLGIPRRVISKLGSSRGRGNQAPRVFDRFVEPIAPAVPTTPPGPRVVLLNDCRDQLNFGASALVDGLFAILARSLPSAAIVPIPSHWLLDTSGGFSGFVNDGAGFRRPRALFPRVADQFEHLGDEWLAGRGGRDAGEFLTRLRDADLVVLNGEGSLYRANLSAIRELFLAWFSKERLGVPTIFVNGMVHLTDVMPVLPAMLRTTFSVLDAVAVREPCSLRNLAQFAPELDAHLFPDSAFALTADEARKTPAVAAIRDQVGASPYFCFDPGPMPLDHRFSEQSALHQLISLLKEVTPQAVLVASAPADRFMERVARETGSVYVETIEAYQEYMALVADAEFVVSGRYHNPIIAAIMGCPTIAFGSTSHKVHGACEMLEGLVGAPYDGTHVRPQFDDIQARARRYTQERGAIGDRLQELCHRRRSEALDLGTLVAGQVRKESSGETTRPADTART